MSTTIRFEPADVTVPNIRAGSYLVDVTDEFPEAEVPYSCRSASCGTCRVKVVQGAEAFDPPEDDELEVLEAFGEPSDVRLCCQLQLAREVPVVVLKVVDPD
jgi:2Fe-2S ferredoxin